MKHEANGGDRCVRCGVSSNNWADQPCEPTEAGVEVVKYDRDFLEQGELQPIAKQDGHAIVVNSYGRFAAKVGDVSISEDTLEAAQAKVHSAHLASLKKTFRPVACYVHDSGSSGYSGPAFFRGIHAGNGRVLWSAPDGTKHDGEYALVFAPDDERLPRLRSAVEELRDLEARKKDVEKAIAELKEGQAQAMYGDLGQTSSWRRNEYARPRIRNDAEKAVEVAWAIVRNVLRPEEETEDVELE